MPIVLDGTNGINTPDLESAGPISGTTGTFSGDVQVDGIATNLYPLVSGTAVASTSGTSIDFTSIPSWVKRVTVMFSGVSTNGLSIPQIQLGDAGGFETTGYLGAAITNTTVSNSSSGILLGGDSAASYVRHGIIVIANMGNNLWAASVNLGQSDSVRVVSGGTSKTLSDTLDRIRITTVNGTDTFDAGSINIMYE